VPPHEHRSPLESTRVHCPVDRLNADGIGISGPESTNPPTPHPPSKNTLIQGGPQMPESPSLPSAEGAAACAPSPLRRPERRRGTFSSRKARPDDNEKEGRNGRKGRKPRTVAPSRSARTAARPSRKRRSSLIIRRLYAPLCPPPIMGNGRQKQPPKPGEKSGANARNENLSRGYPRSAVDTARV
jgi:hypothetical protein